MSLAAPARRLTFLFAIGVTCLAPSLARGLTIHGSYVTQSVTPDPALLVGGGNLTDIFEAAADLWEAAIHDDAVVELFFGWTSLGPNLAGVNSGAFVLLDNQDFWFMDPTPWTDEEFSIYFERRMNLGGTDGPMIVGRELRGFTGEGTWDAFMILLHEIGHALGLKASPHVNQEVQDRDIDITPPRPYAGASILVADANHLGTLTSTMSGELNARERWLLSEADILALAQINGWEDLDLSPSRSVPGDLPLSAAISSAALIALFRTRGLRGARRKGHG